MCVENNKVGVAIMMAMVMGRTMMRGKRGGSTVERAVHSPFCNFDWEISAAAAARLSNPKSQNRSATDRRCFALLRLFGWLDSCAVLLLCCLSFDSACSRREESLTLASRKTAFKLFCPPHGDTFLIRFHPQPQPPPFPPFQSTINHPTVPFHTARWH